MSKIAEWREKTKAYKIKKEVELMEKKAGLGAIINKKPENTPEKEKKPYSTPQLHQIYRFNMRWGGLFLITGLAMIVAGMGFLGLFNWPFGRDVGTSFLWMVVGMLLMGIGWGELLHSAGVKEQILLRETTDQVVQDGEKNRALDEKIHRSGP
jgi:hypothetical protein